jgi:hypothetical protein
MNRPSSLDIARFCGLAPTLGAKYGAGRSAAMSSAFHAHAAKTPEAPRLLARLTPEERTDVLARALPGDLTLPSVGTLRYQDASKELAVALVGLPGKDPIIGTCDMAWQVDDGIVVGDIKATRFSSAHPNESLQMAAYGFALTQKAGASWYIPAHWIVDDGRWLIGERVDVDSIDGAARLEDVVFAAEHTATVGSPGPHCQECYERSHCPEYLMPPELAATSLAKFTEAGAIYSYDDVQTIARLEKTLEVAKRQLKDSARQSGGIPGPDGKIWKPVTMPGRQSADLKALQAAGMTEYIKQGESFEQFRWVKA